MAGPHEPLAAELRRRYGEPHRRYHDVRHLAAVLGRVDELADAADDLAAVRLAAWFHDAVYEPLREDNEAASAALAEQLLTALEVDAEVVAEVVRLVLLTREHDPAPGDGNGEVLSDADLAVLGADPADYLAYAADVRAEYAHVPDAAFAAGRAAILAALLARPRLFRTERGRRRWEDRARTNLSEELSRLAASGDATRRR
jgi:predicted metal-dependent HD superfamily phosphohydrolase